jgi:hypothetical protein
MGWLPQGAPTSGMLANAVMKAADVEITAFAESANLVYTRYSDDLIFSAGAEFSRRDAMELIARTKVVLRRQGFRLHDVKTRVVPPGARRVVLGLLVDEEGVKLLPEFRRRLELHVRGVRKFGIAEHAGHRRFDSVFSMINHVDGGIAFAESVDAAFATRLRDAWSSALYENGYPRDLD